MRKGGTVNGGHFLPQVVPRGRRQAPRSVTDNENEPPGGKMPFQNSTEIAVGQLSGCARPLRMIRVVR
jgi:hypothetical protein